MKKPTLSAFTGHLFLATIIPAALCILPAHGAGAEFHSAGELMLRAALYEGAQLLESFGEVERAFELLRNINDLGETRSSGGHEIPGRDEHSILAAKARLLTKMGLYERADSLLAQLSDPPGNENPLFHYLRRARLNYLAGRSSRALHFLSIIDTIASPLFGDYRAFVMVQSLASLELQTEAVASGEHAWRTGLSSALTPDFEENLLMSAMASKKYALALEVADDIKEKLGKDRAVLPILRQNVEARIALGDSSQAIAIAMSAVNDLSEEQAALELARMIISLFPIERLDSGELASFCQVFLDHGELNQAGRLLAGWKKRTLAAAELESLRYCEGRFLFLQGQYRKALSKLKKRCKDPVLDRQSRLLIARSYSKMKSYLEAAKAYEQYGSLFPHSRIASEALFVAARLYERVNYITKGRQLKSKLAQKYPNKYFGKLAALDLALSAINKRRYESGISILQNILARSSMESEDLLYYLALAYGKNGAEKKQQQTLEKLKAVDNKSFYLYPEIEPASFLPALTSRGKAALEGERGIFLLLKNIEKDRARAYSQISSRIQESREQSLSWQKDQHFQRGRAFLSAGFLDWAERELEVARIHFKNNRSALLVLGKLYDENGMVWESMKVFARLQYLLSLGGKSVHKDAIDILLYPLPFPGLIFEYCARYELPPHLTFAIIREESRFQAGAVSRAGALGLMQLMPATGLGIAKELGYPVEEGSLLLPEVNIAFGIRYASHLLRRCGGNYHMMLAAYNAGLNNARRWFSDAVGEKSIQVVVDEIDFKETRRYVIRTVESANIYASLYGFRNIR